MFQVPALPLSPFCPSLPGCPAIPGGPRCAQTRKLLRLHSAQLLRLALQEDQALFLPGRPGKPLSPEKQI